MTNPRDFKYTKEHEWLSLESENRGKVGITAYAQEMLGDIVFLSLPSPGTDVKQFAKMGEIESVKAVSDLFSPVSGKVIAINQEATSDPKLVNDDPYGKGWLLRVELSKKEELASLMDSNSYDKLISELSKKAKH